MVYGNAIDKPLSSDICVQCDTGYHCFGRYASCQCLMCQTKEAIVESRPMLEGDPKRSTFGWSSIWLRHSHEIGGES